MESDLVNARSVSDYLIWSIAFFPNVIMNIIKNGKVHKDNAHSKAVWERHGEHDTYMTLNEIRFLAKKYIPTAIIKRKLFWRYLLVWEK